MNDSCYKDIEVSSRFPDKPVPLSQNDAIEAYLTLTNKGSDPVELHFNSGQLFDIYLFNDNQELVNQWSEGRMFTQAFQSISLKPGQAEQFGGSLELWDSRGEGLRPGIYTMKVVVKTSTRASGQLFQQLPFEAQHQITLE